MAFLKKKIEKKVGKLSEAFDANEGVEEVVEVAAIKLAYFNGTIINLMKERGHILDVEPENVDHENDAIKKAFEDNKDIFQRPVCAFVTFNT